MNIKKSLGALAVTVSMLLGLTSCITKQDLSAADYRTDTEGLAFTRYAEAAFEPAAPREEFQSLLTGYEKVCENRFLSLYLDRAKAAVAVADRRTGYVWFTNTPAIEQDAEIDTDSKNLFYAQLLVDYLDGQNFKQIDSYNVSVALGAYDIAVNENGLSVTYHLMDNKTNTDESSTKELFTITIYYTLEEESLIVRVPLAELQCPAGILPLSVTVLPHFGGSASESDGYLMVPDGSGALITFGSDKYSSGSYVGNVYGFDETLDTESENPKVQQVCLPVFGIKDGDNAFLAIIEDSAALAAIQANSAGPYSSYNEVFSSYSVHAYQNVSIGNMENASKLIGIQETAYSGDIRLRYAFLDSAEADYSGMAAYYRQYLTEKEGLQPLEPADSMPLNLELLGSVDKLKSMLGIKYQGMESLTTVEQTIEILEQLQQQDIGRINLKYTGWMNGGIRQELPTSISVEHAVGGEKGMEALRDYAIQAGVTLYPAVNFLTTPVDSKGFNVFRMAAMQVDQKDAKAYHYNMVTRMGEDYDSILSPAVLGRVIERFNAAYEKWNISNLCLNDMGSVLYADYTKDNPIDRETAVNILRSLQTELLSGYDSLMVNGGFSYMMPCADVALNVPFSDSSYDMMDEPIPFFQMVFHGYVAYSGSPLNLSYDFETDLLRVIEYGGAPYFQLMAADGSAIKNTEYSYLCSNNYDIWKDRLIQAYEKVNDALAPVQSLQMTGHQKLAEDLYRTDYENGWSVYVNYSDAVQQADGTSIPAKGYALRQQTSAESEGGDF